jgi:thiamine-phosphate pyrophosphorylase
MMEQEETRTRLYLVTPPSFDPVVFKDTLAEALDAGDVGCVQLRLKGVGERGWMLACKHLLPVCRERDIAFLINDYPDIAAEVDADGVHIGDEDSTYDHARKLVGPDRIVGVTCKNSRHAAMEAAEAGADYVAFGAFFPTGTKAGTVTAPIDLLADWAEISVVPSVAIGGITVDNCRPLVAAGADFLAVINGVWGYPDGPAAAVKAFNAIFDAAG